MKAIIYAGEKNKNLNRKTVIDVLRALQRSGIHDIRYVGFNEDSIKEADKYQEWFALNVQPLDELETGSSGEKAESYLMVTTEYSIDENMIKRAVSVKADRIVLGEQESSLGKEHVLVFRKKVRGIFQDVCKKDCPVFIPVIKMDSDCAISAISFMKNAFSSGEIVNRLLKRYEFTYIEYQKPKRTYGGMTADTWKEVLNQTLQKHRPRHALWICDIPKLDREFQEWKEFYKCCFDGDRPSVVFAAGSIKALEKGMKYKEQMIADKSGFPILVLLPAINAIDGLYSSLKNWECRVEDVYLCSDLWMMEDRNRREQCFYQAFCRNMSTLLSEKLDEESGNACIQAMTNMLSCYYHQQDTVRAGNLFYGVAVAEECSESIEQLQLLTGSIDGSTVYSETVQKRVKEAYNSSDFQAAIKRYNFILNVLEFPQKSANRGTENLNAFRRTVLGILDDVLFFCRQKKIACFLADASLLGAWRNEKWIPWSNTTVRLYMPRTSYDRFLKHAVGGLRRKYRLDTVPVSGRIFLGTRVILDDNRYESEFWPGTKKLKLPHVEIMPYETVTGSDESFVQDVLSELSRRIGEYQKEGKKKQTGSGAVEEYMRSLNQEEGDRLLFWDFDSSRGAYLLEEKIFQKKINICFCGLECRIFRNTEVLLRKRYGNALAALPDVKKNLSEYYKQASLPDVTENCFKSREKMHAGVTVIVPVYNTKRYLNRCLLSLVNQTVEELEILVIDDGSSDGSAELLDQWQAEYPHLLRVIHQENTGVSKARMRGIQEAAGMYLGFVDSDDYVEKNMFELLEEKAEAEHADVVVCRYYRENDEDGSYYVPGKWNSWLYGKSVEESPGILLSARPFSWAKLFRKDFVVKNELEFPAFRLGEDSAFVIPALLLARRISILDEALYHYAVDRQDSALHSYRDQRLLEIFDACDYMINRCRAIGKWNLLESELTEYLRRVLAARLNTLKEIEDSGFVKTFIEHVFRYMDEKMPLWNQTRYYQSSCEEAALSDDPYDLAKLTKEGMELYFFGERQVGFWKRLFKGR